MALTSVYYDGNVTETQRAQNLAGSAEYGVYGPADFKVTAHPSIANSVLVKAGRAHGHGVTDTAAEDQVVNCTPLSVGQIRWDLIVVRRNWQPALGGPSTLVAMHAGALAEIPSARKVGPGVEDDQPLFLIKWQGGTSAPVEFIDLRVWSGNNGLAAKSDLVRNYMTSIGTRININGVDWLRRVATNDMPEWVKVGDITIADVPWTNVPLAGAFNHWTTNGWSGMKYAVKNGTVYLNGAVTRATAWNADATCGMIPAAYRPAVRIQGSGVQVEPSVGNVTLLAGGPGPVSFSATWPLV